ncbi:protein serine/threonine kinase, putative [Entamoeba invadens IP1]|uniref:Protein serine/threonine kinase, putative n=1 Tax=Entamoeba invadens IP1 TaxID=370355 RepID=A0A0A1U674_ENTIV|nr:protein serine/threonine kinase, putative [Entamoeba invadens IP1]ELP89852.1 protein serine/threonine kinase, putative [Entamoeba invadens IP1]|eukprot:XP_004256623.1 protein serine/threonine kinase, putative [Entamoeba invadens IP1]
MVLQIKYSVMLSVKNKILEYSEPFCPCDDKEDWYITPLQNVTSLYVEIDPTKTSLNTNLKYSDVFSSESVSIGSTQISFYKSDNVILGISTLKTVDINLFTLTKIVLVVSETILTYKDEQFNAAINTNDNFKILVLRCTNGVYNKTSKMCEDPTFCDDVNCKYCPFNKINCLSCKNQFAVVNSKCEQIANCEYSISNTCFKCSTGFLLKDNLCVSNATCLLVQLDGMCQICNTNNGYINNNGKCVKSDFNSEVITNINTISCNMGFVLNTTNCLKCNELYTNSELCENGKITKCDNSSQMNTNGKCENIICVNPNDQNGKCTTMIDNCMLQSNEKCNECKSEHVLSNNTCNNIKEQNCIVHNSLRCLTCAEVFYFDESTKQCVNCNSSCLTCFEESTKCLSCPQNMYLSNYNCNTNEDLKFTCNQFASFGSGCVVCKDGYYRVGFDCYECDPKCGTCNNKYSCLTCNSTNYKTNGGDCLPQRNIIGCAIKVTQSGCSKCKDGYYTVNTNEYQRCDDNCYSCTLSSNKCTSCINSRVLIANGSCVGFSQIAKCQEITKLKCSKCSFWNVPSEDGASCKSQAVWWVILVVVMFVLIVLFVLIVTIVIVTKIIFNKIHKHEIEKTTTLFAMNKSNIKFVTLQGGVSVSIDLIDLNSDIEQIEVNKETRQVLCVGNTNKNTIKIQFTISSNITKFTIRVDPEVVTLKNGFACEFSVNIKPLCSCKINSTIQLISKNFKTNAEKYNKISLVGVTQQSTRIDYDELSEDKKIGEGSFGVVYQGSFRGNIVAIKKMKTIFNDTKSMVEFNNEVSMLDKFRSKYIVHFYGAVFIPSKVCMVTEFAQYGSLQDLMKHKTSDEVDMNLRIKIMTDAAKGISYLHENGILHRDIKPDNILVLSLDSNENVNAKLTDFGSSRNINLLMTNMTFTKGVGTPKYMAPEILNKEKYKKPADVYSFGVSLFECVTWKEPYPKIRFKFAWDIVDFVASGKRLKKIFHMKKDIYDIVNDMWCQDVYKRLGINDVVTKLESINY